jgi:excisionase family DNA binding protein
MRIEQLLSPEEVAAALGVAKQTLNVWRCTGRYKLPYVKVGRKVKYRQEDVSAFIEQNHNRLGYSSR